MLFKASEYVKRFNSRMPSFPLKKNLTTTLLDTFLTKTLDYEQFKPKNYLYYL